MRRTTNDCVGCPSEMGCLGDYCRYAHVERIYCDECDDEIEEEKIHYTDDGRELCLRCFNKWGGWERA
ncbi:MAG: TraR/DksA C4-type zinc finger protein [[Eubacterium] saphenum]|nr:TraR/DksA C4-type zinc finger protein [[Eubacterium] saphenum]